MDLSSGHESFTPLMVALYLKAIKLTQRVRERNDCATGTLKELEPKMDTNIMFATLCWELSETYSQ